MIDLKIKLLKENAVLPFKATPFDAGMDLTATSIEIDNVNDIITYGTGLAMEIPEGHMGLIFPRSSIYKQDLLLTNAVGVIDSKYRGEVMAKFKRNGLRIYQVGERIAQLVVIPFPSINVVQVQELDLKQDRGGGYGSSGN